LDRAARLEKAGNWDEATKIKEQQAKNAQNWTKAHMDVGMQASQNATSLQREQMSNASAEKIAKERNATEIQTSNARNAVTERTSLSRADQVASNNAKAIREDYDKAVLNGFIGTIDDYMRTHTPGGTALNKSQWKVTEEKPKKG
jgi:IS5 family transposase